ncbi:cytochrome c oxidase subunit NDUFA4 isoform X1 [Hyalella azteca]|uniref:Cytochrome c oxidase subunit NDUFA4 isoform X1 n=1 Tax=Hyalella azteca TaxID=294128 RepID=A0A8B7NGL2_HYAAZ|nr:cytochrome c oxidase subunit NDUFA4 isoform X1 [Hyalella azteca]
MQGLSFASIKKHPSLIPLYFCLGAGCLMATLYTARLALKNPDVSWNRKVDPNEAYRTKQYKFFNQHINWDEYKNPAPRYDEKED